MRYASPETLLNFFNDEWVLVRFDQEKAHSESVAQGNMHMSRMDSFRTIANKERGDQGEGAILLPTGISTIPDIDGKGNAQSVVECVKVYSKYINVYGICYHMVQQGHITSKSRKTIKTLRTMEKEFGKHIIVIHLFEFMLRLAETMSSKFYGSNELYVAGNINYKKGGYTAKRALDILDDQTHVLSWLHKSISYKHQNEFRVLHFGGNKKADHHTFDMGSIEDICYYHYGVPWHK